MPIPSLIARLSLDDNRFRRGINDAVRAFTGLGQSARRSGSEVEAGTQRAARAVQEQARSLERLTQVVRRDQDALRDRVNAQRQALVEEGRSKDAQQQTTAAKRELIRETARLAAILNEEGRTAEGVAAKYAQADEGIRRRLTLVKEQITARQAAARAEEQAATAAEKAAAREAAAAEKAAARRVSLRQAGGAVSQLGRTATLGITAPIVGLAAAGIRQFGEMEQNLNVLAATSNATADQVRRLSAEAIKLGGDMTLPATSAADAARAMLTLQQSGVDVESALKATRSTLQLTAASGYDVANSARLAAAIMNSFALAPAKLSHVMDLLVASQSKAGTRMEEMSQAIKNAATAFRSAGQSPEDLITSLSLLSKAGVRGETAGTALRTMLINLQKDTPKTAAAMKALGVEAFDPVTKRLKPMRQLIDEMSRSLARFTPKARANLLLDIFGTRAPLGVQVLFRGVEAFDKMKTAIDRQGAAAQAATARNKGLSGALDALRSAFDTALIQGVQPIAKDLGALARRVGELAQRFSDLPEPTRRTIVNVLAISAAVGPLLLGLGSLITTIRSLVIVLGLARGAALAMGTALSGPWVALAIAAVVALKVAYDKNFLGMKTALDTYFSGAKKGFELWGRWIKENVFPLFSDLARRSREMARDAGAAAERVVARLNQATAKSKPLGAAGQAIGSYGYGGGGGGALDVRRQEFVRNDLIRRGVLSPTTGIPTNDPLAASMSRGSGASQALQRAPAGPRIPGMRSYAGPALPAVGGAPSAPGGAGTLAPGGALDYDRDAEKRAEQARKKREREREAAEKKRLRELEQARNRALAADRRAQDAAAKLGEENERLRKTIAGIATEEQKVEKARLSHEARFRGAKPASLTLLDQRQAANEKLKAQLTEQQRIEKENEAILTRIRAAVAAQVGDINARRGGADVPAPSLLTIPEAAAKYPGRTPQIIGERNVLLQLNQTNREEAESRKAALRVQQQQKQAGEDLNRLYEQAVAKNMDLTGATDDQVAAFKRLHSQLNLADPAAFVLMGRYLSLVRANEQLTAQQKEQAAQARETERVNDLLGNTMADLNAELDTLTGRQPEQTRAINRLQTHWADLNDEQKRQLTQIQAMFKDREVLGQAKRFADGFSDLMGNAISGLSEGFGGLFKGIYDGFRRLLLDMAAEFLSSQLRKVLTRNLASMVAGGGGGGAGAILPSIASGFGNMSLGGAGAGGGGLTLPGAGLGYGGGLEKAVAGSFGNMNLSTPAAIQAASRGGAGGATNITVNVSGENAHAARQNAGAMAAEIGRHLRRQERRNRGG